MAILHFLNKDIFKNNLIHIDFHLNIYKRMAKYFCLLISIVCHEPHLYDQNDHVL